jgi:hypothetical protein
MQCRLGILFATFFAIFAIVAIFHNFFGHCAPLRMPSDRPEGNTMTVGQSCR